MTLKLVRRAGLAHDRYWASIKSTKKLDPGTLRFLKSRYKKTCAGCGKDWYTQPRCLPLCGECWHTVPSDVKRWWWKKRTQKALETILDHCLDGGYDVPKDPKQLKGWATGPTGLPVQSRFR